MPQPEFFRKHGLFVKRGFLEPDVCARYVTELQVADAVPAGISGAGLGRSVDAAIRHAQDAQPGAAYQRDIARRIASLAPDLAAHFRVTINRSEGPSFLVYRTGGFYRPHRDRPRDDEPRAAGLHARRVSVVLFLNASAERPGAGGYTGGALTLYDLIDDPAWVRYGFAVDAEPGLLVAFRSDMRHEVTPVTAGERYTIVDWFLE